MSDVENNQNSGTRLSEMVLLLDENDNVVIARGDLVAGSVIEIESRQYTLEQSAPTGFKIARSDIPEGSKIIKYGADIGSATKSISAGDIIHVHNMKSDYLPTYTLDGETFTKGDQTR